VESLRSISGDAGRRVRRSALAKHVEHAHVPRVTAIVPFGVGLGVPVRPLRYSQSGRETRVATSPAEFTTGLGDRVLEEIARETPTPGCPTLGSPSCLRRLRKSIDWQRKCPYTHTPSSAIVVLISTASYARIRPIVLAPLYSPPACSLLALETFMSVRATAPFELRNAEKASTSDR